MSSREICWNIVNSALAGVISFGSAVLATGGDITPVSIWVAVITASTVMFIRFAEYWKNEESEYMDENSRKHNKIFNFI